MLKLNKYLRELGYNEDSWPFNEIKYHTDAFLSGSEEYDGRYVEDAPCEDGTINEGFIDAESFNLDDTLAMIIYSQLCYFRDYGGRHVTPMNFNHKIDKNGRVIDVQDGHERWMKCLDDMITAFRLFLKDDEPKGLVGEEFRIYHRRKNRRINYGMKQFVKYFGNLWW